MTPTWPQMLATWGKVAALSFGGPAAQIAVMHRVVVEERRWVGEDRFAHALNFCMLLPGPEAMQLATFLGWWHRGVLGGLLAGGLFVLPGFLSMLLVSVAYVSLWGSVAFGAALTGFQAAVIPVVGSAVLRIGRKVLRAPALRVIAALALVAVAILRVPFPVVLLVAAAVGMLGARFRPNDFRAPAHGHAGEVDDSVPAHALPSVAGLFRTVALWLGVWIAPLLVLFVCVGPDHLLYRIGIFFSQVALVTFGGAYAVLGYVADEVVLRHGWLTAPEMVDGLGFAETTPGPLIQVVQFVAFLAAWRQPGALDPWASALTASVLATWVTYAPCFLWIFAGAPWIEAVRRVRWAGAALAAITAAVVGVIARLALWFASHVLFERLDVWEGPAGITLTIPAWDSFRPFVAALALLAAVLASRIGVPASLLATSLASWGLHTAGWLG